ncbi:MAG: DUF4845 domain-containing protein [Betaproteobacteria bacterium]|nr:DUF4845 domain-containing protein [Betaproteobacteria bacterium]
MANQRGFSFVSMILWLVTAIFVGILALRIVPSYIEYFSLKKIVTDVAATATEGASDADIRGTFGKRLDVNNITRVTPRDLLIERGAQGTVLKLAYSVRQPLAGQASLCLDFEATANAKAGR